MEKPRTRVDRVLNVAAGISIVLAIISVAAFALSSRTDSSYRIGDRFDELPELEFRQAPATLLLFVNTTCGPCNDSIPFYRTLLASVHSARVIAIGREPEQRLSLFFVGAGAQPDAAISIGTRPTRLQFTPTLVLVRSDRTVAGVWTGKLQSSDEEARILELLR